MLNKLFGFLFSQKTADRNLISSCADSVVGTVTADSLFRAAGAAFDRNDTVEALDLYAQVIKLNPEFEKAHVMLGFLFKERSNIEKAKMHLLKAVELNAELADAWYLLGSIAHIEKDTDSAIKNWRRSLEILPSQEQIYIELSFSLYQLKQVEDAVAEVERGLEYFPQNIGMLQHYGNYCLYLFRYEEAIAAYLRAIEQNPNSVEIIYNYIVCCIVLMRFDEAFEGFARIRRIHGNEDTALYMEGVLRLKLGEYEQGWRLYEHRWKTSEMSAWKFVTSKPKWNGTQNLEGKTLLIVSEQGYGDTLQFCRFVPQVAQFGAKIVFVVQSPLFELMHQIPGVYRTVREKDHYPDYDYYCELMSLPLVLHTTLDSIPSCSGYLHSDDSQVQRWRLRLSEQKRRRRIGVVWAGNPQHTNNYLRSVPFDAIKQLFDLDVDFTILQKDLTDSERAVLRTLDNVHFYGDEMTTFADTAALVELMDLVVTVDTSVAHLAGAMSKPTWILTSYHPDWRWMLRTDRSPWYDSVRLFRQQIGEPWANVVETVKQALAK